MPSIFQNQALPFRDFESKLNTNVKGIFYRTASINPASIATVSSAETAVTLNGVAVGDIVLANVPASLETGLAFSGIRVSAANTVQVRLTNVTAGAVDGAARTWEFLVIDLT